MRKVFVDAKIKLIINMDEGVETDDIMDTFYVGFGTDTYDIEDMEVIDYEVILI